MRNPSEIATAIFRADEQWGKPRIGQTCLRVLVCAGILRFIVSKVDLGEVYQLLSRISFKVFVLAFLIYVAAHLLYLLRWKKILQALQITIRLRALIPLQLVGLFFNLFLIPLGGDVVKAYYLSKDTDKRGLSYLSVFIDRYISLFVVITMAAVAALVARPTVNGVAIHPWVASIFVVVILLTILLSTNFAQRLNKLLGTRFKAIQNIISLINDSSTKTFKNYSMMIWTFSFSIGVVLLVVAINYILISCTGKSVELGALLIFIPLIALAAALPVSIGGLGLREGAYIYLFSTIGFTPAESLSLGLLNFALLFFISVPGAIVYLLTGKGKSKLPSGYKIEDEG